MSTILEVIYYEGTEWWTVSECESGDVDASYLGKSVGGRITTGFFYFRDDEHDGHSWLQYYFQNQSCDELSGGVLHCVEENWRSAASGLN